MTKTKITIEELRESEAWARSFLTRCRGETSEELLAFWAATLPRADGLELRATRAAGYGPDGDQAGDPGAVPPTRPQ